MTPLERLCLQDSVDTVDTEGALTFSRALEAGLLFLPGDRARPEVSDVAVVLSTLHEKHPELRVAVAEKESEDALRKAFGISAFPSLLFVKGGDVKIALARMQTWSIYEGAARSIAGAA